MEINILGISGSPQHGNTEVLTKESLKAASKFEDVDTEYVSLAEQQIKGGCKSTHICRNTTREKLCMEYRDDVNTILEKMINADGMIIGSPVYWGRISAQLAMLLDRTLPIQFLGFLFRNKVGGAISVAYDRQGGHEGTIYDIHKWFLTHGMIPVGIGSERSEKGIGCSYGVAGLQGWPEPTGSSEDGWKTAVREDDLAMNATRTLGKRVTEVTKAVKLGFLESNR